ncbi:sodium-coupled monocarboxylate transporter 2 [Labeo rohita]|uniref:Sodium-coupled monocarboxylate transporter 2 n=1 Tax=Labeo rohita TaxID=84645 RepID=A0A498L3R4_LABRO|nr:sodium-coupled monocarboxylate transporter 2 [Labeo rohita]RXN30074.1 sodium-coupled monocarboxylate transporter 2 [Labeo rohita]
MEDKSNTVGTFQVGDYVVFAFLFVISSGIGVFFAIKERKKASSKEFLVGGRQMSCGPVALSLTASFMSAVTVIGGPSDVYRYGASYVIFGVAYTFVVFLTAELFLPVFYRSGITSTYEYLELRFCRLVRVAATLIYIIQTILYTGVVVYAPALALNQVTGFDLWGSIFATGIVCTFYCTLGGLKAVVWTDAFQMVVMVVGFLTVLIQGASRAGGIESVWSTAHSGGRMHIFEALYLNLLGLWIILFCAVVSGLIMYAFYSHCDPWSAGLVSAPDQLMPYFVMEILGVVFGVACTTMAVAASYMGGIVQAALSIHGMCGGPMLGLFSLGILFPVTNLKGAVGGLIMGISLSFWVGVGAFIYPAPSNNTRPLELNTAGCSFNTTADGFNQTSVTVSALTSDRFWLADSWYSMSYLYYSAVGFIGTVAAGLLITLLTGPMDPKEVKPGLTRSVKEVICFCSERNRQADFSEDKEDLGDFGTAWEKHPDKEDFIIMEEKVKSCEDNLQENGYTNAAFDLNESSRVQAKL